MLDLAYGDPVFLETFWKEQNLLKVPDTFDMMKYQYDILPRLKDSIIRIHKEQGNAETIDKHIVVGNGATQLLIATIASIKQPVYAQAPYFFRFPTMALLSGPGWDDGNLYFNTEIVTSPNNPDGKLQKPTPNTFGKRIYDLSYNWKQYTDPVCYNEDIMIFSLAKATGHASTRIGWAFFRDKDLASKVSNYIEIATMGVSVEAQYKASVVLDNTTLLEGKKKNTNIFDFGREILDNRWNTIKKLDLPFEIMNNSGMFAWCKGECPDGLGSINGSSFGYSDNYFRLSLGCSEEDFNRFCLIFGEKK